MVAENIQHIRRRIAAACDRAARKHEDVGLIAVSKTFGASMIEEAVNAGVPDIGENFVQELRPKQRELAGLDIRWHFIGHLQSNKIRYIIEWITLVHSVDSIALGRELSKAALRCNRVLDVLVEVNTSGEKSKFGVRSSDAPALVESLMRLSNLRVVGLMTIGPFLPDPEESRPAFQELRHIQTTLRKNGIQLPHLSMGMTQDFEVAIEEGSTMVRIGTGIFGKRAKPA